MNFSGGEIFLYKELKEILEYSKSLGFKVVVNTNGTINIFDYISYIDEIIFSVHGLESLHNDIVHNINSFKSLVDNIIIANDYNVPVEINMTLIKKNFFNILDVYNYFNSRYKIWKFSPTIAIKVKKDDLIKNDDLIEVNKENLNYYFSVLDKISKEQLDLKEGLHSIYYNDNQLYENTNISDSPFCIGGKTKIIVSYNGDVYPCNFFQTEDYYCGNLLYGDIDFIWKEGKGFNIFRNMVLDEKVKSKCHSCKKYFKCFSGCRAWTNAYLNSKGKKEIFENESDFRCEIANAFIGT